MTWAIEEDELLIEPTTVGAQKSLAVWPVKESGCSILAQRGDDNLRFFLDQQETDALAKHLDPEAAQAKLVLRELMAWLETEAENVDGFDVRERLRATEALDQKVKDLT